MTHDVNATGASEIILEPSSPTGGNIADGEFWFDYINETNSGSVLDTGVIFRATDANNFMSCFIRLSGPTGIATVDFEKRVAGTYTSVASSATTHLVPFFPSTGLVRARVLARFVGAHIEIYVNEVFVGACNDSTFTTGICGVRHIARQSANQVASYDNATMYSLASTWTYPVYD
ncbi:MAG TPA: hypothetical protein VJL80_06425 [Aeromicrobium sp.]|nr:hypothetical protein [Aeromicrobium sp.]HKY57654.1 hypothetical protein [Aeromicrobium sp.]